MIKRIVNILLRNIKIIIQLNLLLVFFFFLINDIFRCKRLIKLNITQILNIIWFLLFFLRLYNNYLFFDNCFFIFIYLLISIKVVWINTLVWKIPKRIIFFFRIFIPKIIKLFLYFLIWFNFTILYISLSLYIPIYILF